MLKFFGKSLVVMMCFAVLSPASASDVMERPNEMGVLYAPPWEDEMAELVTSCKDLNKAECSMLKRLYQMPHAYLVGLSSSLGLELQELHGVLLDARSEGKVPTIVLYSFPFRDCGGGVPLGKDLTADDYKKWIDQVGSAVRYYQNMPLNIIIEPGGLANVVTDVYKLCNERKRSDILLERIELVRYVLWSFAVVDKHNKRINPNLRLFIDVGSPDMVSGAREKLAVADALEEILKSADFDGISVSGASNHSFDENVAWGKDLITMIRSETRKKLTIAADIGRSGNKVVPSCNGYGMALDSEPPTLSHPDPQIELVIIMSVPGEMYTHGPGCDKEDPLDYFNLQVFLSFLRNTTVKFDAKQ